MKEFAKALFPPDIPAVVQWRLATFAGVFTLFVFATWSLGGFSSWGFGSGFAHSEHVKRLGDQLNSVQSDLLESSLFDNRSKWCRAIEEKKSDKKFYAEKSRELQKRYKDSAGYDWRLPDCDEL